MNKQKKAFPTEPMAVPAGRAKKRCSCGNWFTLPKCHANRHKSCSEKCRLTKSSDKIVRRGRSCQNCGGWFIPRLYQLKSGQGKFCSISCGVKAFAQTDEFSMARKKGGETYKKSLAAGAFVRPTGLGHKQWRGGPLAARKRRVESGKSKEYCRRYRAENPLRVREWTQKRRDGFTGRLPRGTIPWLFKLQSGKCALCKTGLPKNFHVDHIMPISLGGEHEPKNIQLLCPTCNVKKWATHPVDFAQKRGMLL